MIIDTQSLRAAAGVPKTTTGLDANKKASGRKRGLAVDVLGVGHRRGRAGRLRPRQRRRFRDLQDPDHFVSFASWWDPGAMRAWKNKPEFAEHFGSGRALCTDMQGGGYQLVRAI